LFEVKKTKHDLRAQPPRRSCFFHSLPDSVFLPHRPHLSHHIYTQLTSSPYSRLSLSHHIPSLSASLFFQCPSGAYIPLNLNIHLSQKHASLPLLAVRATTPQLNLELWHACATRFASNRASSYFTQAYRAAKIPVQAPCRILRRPSLHTKSSTYCDNLSFYHKGVGLVLVLCTFSDQSYAKTKNLIFCRIYTINYSFIHFLPQKSVKIKRVETCIYIFLHINIHVSTYFHISHNNKHIPPSVNVNRNVAQRSENLRIDATNSLHAKCPSKPVWTCLVASGSFLGRLFFKKGAVFERKCPGLFFHLYAKMKVL